ncbi:ELMO domain-containing protein 2-like isoform X2 [Varroa jacobsoni]|uniref:ELMO domain-containing protein n=2 Tax=Varroa TaxID=62624 RepID=A0A7M7JUA0_VARDE|nr:ELMO domain-containing protein 2-like [Varroa destructor]XP_022656984.1 ELMO domain-containing protein 2-like [Varroa destructor]XP_022656994.1 ELMO domain-containing protein 2-like [Varroa destructor]XP_022657004.1 ELMO domain-containing protein 2-like [Varroa destructor]XP_022689595.1 ELMO domain-containing protein 2-like isoform X2 [Varroa jacobsoni]XP_022689596.1 ELMO domain-containing protein 2-like isoform X2 [Varroa jacobsoni]
MWEFIDLIFVTLYDFFRSWIKGFMRRLSNLCELQRICYGTTSGYERTIRIERSLEQSRQLQYVYRTLIGIAEQGRYTEANSANAVEAAVSGIAIIKKVKPTIHREFVRSLRFSLNHLCSYQQLIFEAVHVSRISFDSNDSNHVKKLKLLWKGLRDDVLEDLVSKQWQDIGFQGDDPRTDFRGMGMLGLDQLVFFVTQYNSLARHVLNRSLHPKFGYSFAIVGINLTDLIFRLLRQGKLKTHLYNAMRTVVGMEDFHKLYCYVFVEFDRLWLAEKPRDIMEFGRIRDKFEEQLVERLKREDCVLNMAGTVETI